MSSKSEVPKTLNEAIQALDELLIPEDKERMHAGSPDDIAIELHHSLGRHLRNEWGLWTGGPLKEHLIKEHGITHPDDMSGYIIRAYLRRHFPTIWEAIQDDEQ